MPKPKKQPDWIVAAALAWLIPGLGHVYLGKLKRGVILFVAISAMFYTGVSVGGTMTVDQHGEPYWFIAQMGCGAHGLVGWHRQNQVYDELNSLPEFAAVPLKDTDSVEAQRMTVDAKLAERNLALSYPEDNIARVYSGVAGMLNVICIVDAAFLALMLIEVKRKKEGVEVKA